jgi:hypothetical protein
MIFEMSDNQKTKLQIWQDAIEVVYGNKGDYEYIFTPIENGYSIRVYSDLANFELDLTEIETL